MENPGYEEAAESTLGKSSTKRERQRKEGIAGRFLEEIPLYLKLNLMSNERDESLCFTIQRWENIYENIKTIQLLYLSLPCIKRT